MYVYYALYSASFCAKFVVLLSAVFSSFSFERKEKYGLDVLGVLSSSESLVGLIYRRDR